MISREMAEQLVETLEDAEWILGTARVRFGEDEFDALIEHLLEVIEDVSNNDEKE